MTEKPGNTDLFPPSPVWFCPELSPFRSDLSHFNLSKSRPYRICPPHQGLRPIRRSFIKGVYPENIIPEACEAGKKKMIRDH